MGYFGLLILLTVGLPDTTMNESSRVAQVHSSEVRENGLLILSIEDEWKYHPGDNVEWAQPGYDDSNWHNISPGGLQISEMPDSLWPGYGWWRLTFEADSAFYSQPWNLYFYGWGAAEVYVDGKLIHSYGTFSTYVQKEVEYAPRFKPERSFSIQQGKTHTVAVRYSYHKAKKYESIFFQKSGNLGFGLGFANDSINDSRAYNKNLQTFTLGFSGAALLILLLLHITLYLKFQEDRSNLVISVFIGLLLLSCTAIYSGVFIELNRFWYLISQNIWAYSASIAIISIPYLVASIFRIEAYKKFIYLLGAFPILAIAYHFSLSFEEISILIVYIIAIILTALCIWKAYTLKKKGVRFVALGALGTLVFTIIHSFYLANFFDYDLTYVYINAILIYTFFPFGLTLYIANRYGYLYGSLDKEVKERTKELEEAYSELQKSLQELKATQSQLIQQEKLASLGQLTAGIAHEIKNPLNFVNNFSELSMELIEEAREELLSEKAKVKRQKLDEVLAILDDIEANLRKIHEHGSRADSIVKSMLQHSRGGSGKMEPTDLNALVEEYVNLSFHGMRASKDPINVDIEMALDEEVGEVSLIAEDFSRVIVNVCNNAFDAMREKLSAVSDQPSVYQPKLTVYTNKSDDVVMVEIEDNGPGIPEEMKDKILQPFFTTKKGTEGTGLGLSITNDIIKAHGGSLDIDSKQGEYTIFKISLNKR